ncbi:aldo/keto reductase [Oceanobacillus chungangensis]|uniref:Oxidoreductase n=1 Tax=Oceanobacillus chungangensis TaxID=1229152 RepID=A0A3D8PMT7_9BACI|nr:aldo/keto reductase [Oceanobacillus chungangensis]RDW17410.1 oxidoreductase [Oceanobacillus chungangensis]
MVERVELGKTGLYVHPIGLGANKIGEEDKETNTDYGGKIINAAIESGLNFIDTAYIYGKGLSEEIIGKTLKENRNRKNVILATKGAHRFEGDKMIVDNSPAFLIQTVEESLKRLQTDVIDLFYIHFPDIETPKYEAIGTLQRLKESGKIRSIGVSNFSFEQLKEANQDGYIDVVQDEYNLINRKAETALFPFFLDNNISFIPYYPLASGLLAGKYRHDTVFSERQKSRPQFQDDVYFNYLEKVDKFRAIADKHNVDVAHIVLAFYLTRETIDSVIPGARNRQQIEDNLKAAEVKLTKEDIQFIDDIFPV